MRSKRDELRAEGEASVRSGAGKVSAHRVALVRALADGVVGSVAAGDVEAARLVLYWFPVNVTVWVGR